MKIGIAGYGFVGKAHEGVLKDYHDLIIYDPALGHYGDLRHADAIIICVSTPEGSHGGCHMDNVYCIVEDNPNVPILIKYNTTKGFYIGGGLNISFLINESVNLISSSVVIDDPLNNGDISDIENYMFQNNIDIDKIKINESGNISK